MKSLDKDQWREFIEQAGMDMADPDGPTLAELTYKESPQRTLVIHFADRDIPAGLSRTLGAILAVQEGWYLFKRAGNFPVSFFERDEIANLKYQLVNDLETLVYVDNDLYVVGMNGKIYFSYDHHFMDDGLGIFVQDIPLATTLLTQLNNVGSEVESFSK